MSVLAHVVTSMGKGEREVTRALAYILNRHPDLVQKAFVKLLDPAGIRFQPSRQIEREKGDDDGRIPGQPDMKIFDKDGNLRVLVENKFWADLTPAQPVGYLKMLQSEKKKDVSSGLLFVVPEKRVTQLWNALKTRCDEARLALGQASPEGARVRWVRVGDNTMLITDWQNVLHSLNPADVGDEVRCDLFQFRRLVETLEGSGVFLVLCEEEVKNMDVAQRMVNYIDLLDLIRKRLPDIGMGITCGQASASFDSQSFHCKVMWNDRQGRRVRARLALSFDVWHRSGGITPLWLRIKPPKSRPTEVFETLQNLLEKEGMHVFLGTNNKYIAIDLKLDVERNSVVEGAVEQIRIIVQTFT